jgi:hypothetical protein
VSNSPSITNADESKLVELIQSAEARIVYLAPGISEEIADALSDAWDRLGADAVSVILDVDPEVCRLGFGTIEGLQKIRQVAAHAGSLACHHPGVRIGLLISDNTTLVFSPTPLLIEAGSNNPQRPNAILLGTPPDQLAKDVGLGENPNIERVVGLDPIRPHQIDEVAEDLKAAPPVKFDLARRVRVFTSRFQFVELEMTGCLISRKKVAIPSLLVGLARDRDVASQFHAQFDLVQQGQIEVKTEKGNTINERSLLKRRKDIEDSFLVKLTGYGTVVLRGNKERLLEAVEQLKSEVSLYSQGAVKQLHEQMNRSSRRLVDALFPSVKQNPPDSYTKLHGPAVPDEYLRQRLEEDIAGAFGDAATLVEDMQVKVVFKDVAYESLVDSKFLDIARKAMPGLELLHDEYDAAPETEER